jgi:organic radical activating enzyme
MTYEFILTDSCNRNCKFCYVKHSGFYATKQDADTFINQLNSIGLKATDHISLFGGEPCLNKDILSYLVGKLSDLDCEIDMYTNGDLLHELKLDIGFKHVNLYVTAYDILNDCQKYKMLMQKFSSSFKSISFSYTLSQIDIDKTIIIWQKIKSLNGKYSTLAFSHSADSWNSIIDIIAFKCLIKNMYFYFLAELEETGDTCSLAVQKLKQCIEIDYSHGSDSCKHCCLDSKKTFYHGKFIGCCIQFYKSKQPNKESVFDNILGCRTCKYKVACSKSCPAEITSDAINKMLCTIEKTGFEAVYDYSKCHENDIRWKNFIRKILV